MKKTIVILAATAAPLLAACSDATASVNTTGQPAVPVTASVSSSQLNSLPEDTDNRLNGIVQGVASKDGYFYARVLRRNGSVTVLVSSDGCGSVWENAAYWKQLLTPGDAIDWSTKGHDNRVCPDEVSIRPLVTEGR